MWTRFFAVAAIWALCPLGILVASTNPDVVLYMAFDQPANAEVVQDLSMYGNHGVVQGNVEWTQDGRYGGALEFDGASRIEIPHTDSLDLDSEMSLQVWFRTDVPQKGRFLIYKMHIGGGRNYEWGVYLTSDSTNASMYVVAPNDDVAFPGKVGEWGDDDWHFLVGTYDGDVVKCCVDGELGDQTDWSADIRASEGAVVIGTWGTNFFTGLLDEVRVLNVALSSEQISREYEQGYSSLAVRPAAKLSLTWGQVRGGQAGAE